MVAEHISMLLQQCNELGLVCRAILGEKVRLRPDDAVGFMIATFCPLQLSHLKAVIQLVNGGMHVQSTPIARMMLEGLALAQWARRVPARAHRWRAYSLIHDLRLITYAKDSGENLDASHEAELLERLRIEASVLLKPKLRNRTDRICLTSLGSYHNVWHVDATGAPVAITTIIEEALADPELKTLYGELSRYVHWDISCIANHLDADARGYSFDIESNPRSGAASLATAFQCCIEIFRLFLEQFALPQHKQALETCLANYFTAMNRLGPPPRDEVRKGANDHLDQ